MSDFAKFDVKAPAGVNFAREPSQLNPNLWDNAENITFRHGKTLKCTGYEQGFGIAYCNPEVIVPLRADDQNFYWWTYAGKRTSRDEVTGKVIVENKVYKITAKDTHSDVTPPEGIVDPDGFLEPLRWSGSTINSVPYLCRGKPYAWDQDTDKYGKMKKFPEHVSFRIMRTYRNYMLGLNFETKDFEGDFDAGFGPWNGGTHQNAIWWSHDIVGSAIQPTTDWGDDVPSDDDYQKSMWCDADPTRNSGWNFLGGSGGPILEAKELRDSFIIYRERSVWQMTYIGGINVFSFKELFDDVGAINENCVVEIEGQHLVIGSSDVYMHNGVQKQSIVDGIVREEIFKYIDPLYYKNVFVSVDYSSKEAWICIPESFTNRNGACNVAYVHNWKEQTWSRREIPDLITSVYAIIDLPNEDVSWEHPDEGGPSDPITGLGVSTPGTSWAEVTDTWLDSYYKYNPSSWGLVFGSTRAGLPTLSGGLWDDAADWDEDSEYNDWNEDPEYFPEGSAKLGYSIYTSVKEPLFNRDNFEAYVEKRWLDMGDRSDASFVSKIYPLVRKGVVDVYMDGTNTVDQDVRWKYIGQFNPGPPEEGSKSRGYDTKLSCRISGQFIHIKFVFPESSRAEIRGYTLEYTKIGRRA